MWWLLYFLWDPPLFWADQVLLAVMFAGETMRPFLFRHLCAYLFLLFSLSIKHDRILSCGVMEYNPFSILHVPSACTDFEARMASQMAKLHSWSCCCRKNKWNYLQELHGHIKSKFYLTFLIRWCLIGFITLASYFPAFKWRSFWFLKGWNDAAEDQRA